MQYLLTIALEFTLQPRLFRVELDGHPIHMLRTPLDLLLILDHQLLEPAGLIQRPIPLGG